MSDDRRVKADERKLIFQNLVMGAPMPEIMKAFRKSEKEVMDVFHFVARKINSYRFERMQTFVRCETIRHAQQNPALLLYTLERLNLDRDPSFRSIETLPFGSPGPSPMSEGELRLLEVQRKAAEESRRRA